MHFAEEGGVNVDDIPNWVINVQSEYWRSALVKWRTIVSHWTIAVNMLS